MTRTALNAAMSEYKSITHDALQLIWYNTNKGQRKKMLKNEDIAALLARYNITTEEE